ncbi:MAG: tRNA (N6-isopentenyl adenosine(37)-C2)-methylthiotransferase MiaB [Ruminococcaceae bacterium]|nr:tRNA (N6-isopentenyl adenosine(37)-C2)-methylthiotransferase MiaB [Oscillospiraceae bacterium]
MDATRLMRQENDRYAMESGRSRRAFVLTFGCQQNEADSEKIAGMAQAMGYGIADAPEQADLIVVNTCAVREHAEKRALSTVGQYKHLKAQNPELVIAMCGCMVSQEHRAEEIKRRYPYVNFIFGTSMLQSFPCLLWEWTSTHRRVFRAGAEETAVAEGLPIRRENGYRAWVSIMYGCNNFCSYCIVPYVRGRERSREPEPILEEIRSLVAAGYRDITLLGQNVNSYGKGTKAGWDFADLLAEADKIQGDYVLRFMTSHPKDAGKKLIDVMAASTHIAHQFHLPLQSGSDAVLKKMNRRYTTETYTQTLDYLREKMPDVTVTSDIIVGFPGESEEDFEATLKMIDRARFDMIFSFIYSPRKGTPAAEMENQVPADVTHTRFDRLLARQNVIGLEKNTELIGKTLRVLCDGESKNDSLTISGRTEGNKLVFWQGDTADRGKFVRVKITGAEPFALQGEPAED